MSGGLRWDPAGADTLAALGWQPTVLRYNPQERRDWHGRWGAGGSHAASQAAAYLGGLSGKVQLRELNDYTVPEYERTRLDPMRDGWTPEQARAVDGYVDASFEMNQVLRGTPVEQPRFAPADTRAKIEAMAAAARPLPDDLVLLREVKGRNALAAFEPGDVLADDAFASTTLRPGRFGGGRDDTTVMHILAPKGTPVIWAGRMEDELVLPPGTAMVVVSKRKPAGSRGRFVSELNLLVLPKGML